MGLAAADILKAARARGIRVGISADAAGDVLWFLTGPWAYRAFVIDRAWSLDAYEEWMAGAIVGQLLGERGLGGPTEPFRT